MQLSAGLPKISKGKKEEKALYFGIPVVSGQVDAGHSEGFTQIITSYRYFNGFHASGQWV
ncbi:MAG: hypothetical protein LBG18_02545 [Mediterranea sp.]|jgi:hypothetical protein|nr:hypothetical protein [Mediterranea sp.]